MIKSREDIPLSSRIVIKAGTAVISNPDGYPSLTRMADLVEQCARLVHSGKEVILVSSGAVGVGKRRLAKQGILRRSMSDFLIERDPMHHFGAVPAAHIPVAYTGASAAAGQLGIMSLYEQMFTQYDITISQLLVTTEDFTSPQRRRNIQYVIKQLLALGIIPIINENDAISASFVETTVAPVFSDNDSLASMVSVEMNAHLLILLTDVAGVFDRPPSETGAKLIDIFGKSTGFKVGSKSTQGRGGMGAKVNAALAAIRGGVSAVAIAAGTCSGVVGSILHGEKCGTLFLSEILDQYHVEDVPVGPANTTADGQKLIRDVSDGSSTITDINPDVETIAQGARMGGRELQALSADERTNIVLRLAKYIEDRAHLILAANEDDLAAAVQNGLNLQLLNRLRLTKDKIFTLVKGIRAVAAQEDPIGKLLGKTELAEGLILDKVSCPIGVLLVIFESRPDCLPQIAALALRSGNGLVLKGGKEAEATNGCLYAIVRDAIHDATDGAVSSDTIGLVQSHDEINELLKLDDLIDLVIPRGSNSLVSFIKSHTRIPVMGHADGVCHVYVDADADMAMAARIVIDSKIDYPSACNAAESLLIHECHVNTGAADKLLRALRSKGVALYGGPEAVKQGLTEQIAVDLHREYGDLQITVEVVRSMQHAVQHINTHGSGHTECIVTENAETAELFTRTADSACVFHNASTRFADGFRFGLGAEVGISTGRIHARGP
eukprot:gene21650-24549_t